MARTFAEKPAPIPMDDDTQLRVCLAIVRAGVTHICDDLDKLFTVAVPFETVCHSDLLRGHAALTTYGYETDERMIEWYISQRYYLCNYRRGRLSIHYPSSHGGGLCTYIIGPLAEKYGRRLKDPFGAQCEERHVEDQRTDHDRADDLLRGWLDGNPTIKRVDEKNDQRTDD